MGLGVNNRVYAIAARGTKVYVGGDFNLVGGVNLPGLAVWDTITRNWSMVGGGKLAHSIFSPGVRALAFDAAGNLYAGGQFEQIGGVTALNIARWNGSSWSALGSGAGTKNDRVDAVAVSGSDVYAGGSFSNGITHWNGTTWSGLGGGTVHSFYQGVDALAISGNLVYAGGDFSSMFDSTHGDVTANHIAQWDTGTSTWAPLSNGANNGIA